ncbi:ABC transporter permease [Leptolyngbya sp. 15MV]|nr:ABC transporter permease [Leptolyngbya sp. 15MV]
MAYDSVVSHKFRSFLTILGIVVGIITAVVVASILTGMRQSIVAMFEECGTNNIYLFHLSTGFGPPNRDERNRKPLTWDDAQAVLAQSSSVEDITTVAVNIGSWGSGFDDNMIYKDKNYRWALTDGVEPNYAQVTNLHIRTGRWLTEMDNYERRNVLVIGINAVEALFNGDPDEALGKVIRMNGQSWEIVGVLEKRQAGFFGENEEDRKIFMPFRTARKVAPTRDAVLHIAQAKTGQLNDAVNEIEGTLRLRRGVKYGEPNDFDVKTADDFMRQLSPCRRAGPWATTSAAGVTSPPTASASWPPSSAAGRCPAMSSGSTSTTWTASAASPSTPRSSPIRAGSTTTCTPWASAPSG